MPNGIPSADTFTRVFQRLKPDEFLRCLSSVVAVLRTDVEQEVVAIDDQTLRGLGDGRTGRHPLHLVRAWAATNRLVLGQQACAEKSNEITAIPQLLKLIDIEGAIVTIDAMGCQTDIAAAIVERGADYVLAVKDNQPKLHAEIRESFEQAMRQATSGQSPAFREHVERKQKRGRDEERHYYLLPRLKGSRHSVAGTPLIPSAWSFAAERSTAESRPKCITYLSSLPLGVKRFARAARSHWGIENRLHWSLDVVFAQDVSRIRKDASPEIASMLRQLALMILQQDTRLSVSLRCKRKQASWNNHHLESLIAQINAK